MVATKTGNDIYVTGVGNTLQSVVDDINDPTWMISSNEGSYMKYTFIHHLDGNCYFRVRPGGTLTIGDPANMALKEVFAMSSNRSTAFYHRFYIDVGANLELYGNSVMNFKDGTSNPNYNYIYGRWYVSGNATYKPLIEGVRRNYFYETRNDNTYPNDIWEFRNCVFGIPAENGAYPMYIYYIAKIRNHIFDNIEFSGGTATWMYPIYLPYRNRGMSKLIFNNIYFNNVYAYGARTAASIGHWKDCTFGVHDSWRAFCVGGNSPYRNFSHDDFGICREPQLEQDLGMYLEDCIFCNSGANRNMLYCYYDGRTLLKGCDFRNTFGDHIESRIGGMVRIWLDNTFARYPNGFDLDYNGTIHWVYNLDLTIQDESGNPLSGAVVTAVQCDGNERYSLLTGINGHMKNMYGISGMLLTNKQQWRNSPTTNVDIWSSGSNNTYHDIYITKDGYRPHNTTYVIDRERSDTITLNRLDSHSFIF